MRDRERLLAAVHVVPGHPGTGLAHASRRFEHVAMIILRRSLHAVSLVLALFGGAGAVQAQETPSDAALVAALRAGGLNIYFRHAETDWSQSDQVREPGDWESCDPARIRQLSEEGRETARRIGAAMRTLGVPVGQVLSSPYCRCVDTARLMNQGPVSTTLDVMNMRDAEHVGGRARVIRTARRLLARAPRAGTNTVIVAHGNVAREATPVYPDEGEGVVFQPQGDEAFRVLARVPLHAWESLAAAFPGREP